MARILIVDDEPLNRELLHAHLESSGHALTDAESGEQALALAQASLPDLVLLDVMMPGIDGFETARRLKELAGGEFMPIILLTSLHDVASRVTGLRMGADDFLTKPFNRAELMARANNLLALRAKEVALQARNIELLELHKFKDEMTEMLVHDLKSPISVIVSNLEYMVDQLHNPAMLDEPLTDSREAGRRLLRLIENLLNVTRLEASRLELHRTRVKPAELLNELVHQRALVAQSRGVKIGLEDMTDTGISVDVDLMSRALENILDNALRHTPARGRIEASASLADNRVQIRIGNTGRPIPREARTLIFEKFAQAGEGGRMNLGLGLYFCRLVAEAHQGRIWTEETPALPTVFGMELPV